VQLVPARQDNGGAAGVPEARRYPVTFHRAGLAAMAMIRASGVARVVATADAGSAAAVRWLKRLGFEEAERQPIAGRILFVWSNRNAGVPPAPSS